MKINLQLAYSLPYILIFSERMDETGDNYKLFRAQCCRYHWQLKFLSHSVTVQARCRSFLITRRKWTSLKSGYEQNYNVKDPRYLRWRALRPQISSQRWIFVISEPKGAMIKVICIVLPLISSPLFNIFPHSARVRIP